MSSDFHQQRKVSPVVELNIEAIKQLCSPSLDLIVRPFLLGNGQQAAVFYIDGLIDSDLLGLDFFHPLMQAAEHERYTIDQLSQQVLTLGSISRFQDLDLLVEAVLQGLTALFIEGEDTALAVQAIKWQMRSVSEPATDVVIRGPREGFIESMRVNVSLLRRKIHHPDFVAETVRVGRYSRTDIALVYIDSIVNRGVLIQLKQRLKEIDIDSILDSGYIEQLIQDKPYSLLPTMGLAEKPDVAAARLLEGRIAIIVDGSPIALTVPMLFIEALHTQEDEYTRFYYASWIRIIRMMALVISIYLPGYFLAVVGYHHQVIPFRLLLSMSAAEAETPFTAGFSMLMIGLAYEILREAGIRLPKPAGQAISIVGAIVMGDAAVSANLLSAPVLIVLAITVVASFVNVAYVDAAALLRVIFLVLAWMLGFWGLLLGTMAMLIYLCSLESYGVPYFAPFAPLDGYSLRDTAVRPPLTKLRFRWPWLSRNHRRQSDAAGKQP